MKTAEKPLTPYGDATESKFPLQEPPCSLIATVVGNRQLENEAVLNKYNRQFQFPEVIRTKYR